MFLLPKTPVFLLGTFAAFCFILAMSINIYRYFRKLTVKKPLTFADKLNYWFGILTSIPVLLMGIAVLVILILREYEIWMP